jgi:MinD superfamily P-loop ATPase
MIVKDWCSYCGECSGVCHRDCIEVREYNLVFSQDCNDCGICVDACPLAALEIEEK